MARPPAPEPPEPGEPIPTEPPAPAPTDAPDPTDTPAPDDGGGLLPEFPDPWEYASGAMAGFADSLGSGVAALIDQLHINFLTLPAAGQPNDPATWMPPSDPFWQVVFMIYWSIALLIVPLVWAVGWLNIGLSRGVSRRRRAKQFIYAFVGILAGWTLLMGWIHFWNVAALEIAPAGDEFLATPGSGVKLGVGVVVGLGLVIFKAIFVALGIALQVAFVVMTYTFVAFWPFAVGLWATGMFPLSPMGRAWITSTLLLPIVQFVKAGTLRLVFEFPLDFLEPETAASFLMIVIGVLLGFVVIPWYALKYLTPQTVVSAGGQVETGARDRMGQYRDRAPSREQIRTVMADGGQRVKGRLGDRNTGSRLRTRSSGTSSDTGTDTRSRSGVTYRQERDYK